MSEKIDKSTYRYFEFGPKYADVTMLLDHTPDSLVVKVGLWHLHDTEAEAQQKAEQVKALCKRGGFDVTTGVSREPGKDGDTHYNAYMATTVSLFEFGTLVKMLMSEKLMGNLSGPPERAGKNYASLQGLEHFLHEELRLPESFKLTSMVAKAPKPRETTRQEPSETLSFEEAVAKRKANTDRTPPGAA